MRRILIAVALIAGSAEAGQTQRTNEAEQQWQSCVVGSARQMTGRGAPETVVEAAFGQCGQQEDAFRLALRKWSRGPLGAFGTPADGENMDRMVDTERRRIRSAALAGMLAQ